MVRDSTILLQNLVVQKDGANSHNVRPSGSLLYEMYPNSLVERYGLNLWQGNLQDLIQQDVLLCRFVEDQIYLISAPDVTQRRLKILTSIILFIENMYYNVWIILEYGLHSVIRKARGHVEHQWHSSCIAFFWAPELYKLRFNTSLEMIFIEYLKVTKILKSPVHLDWYEQLEFETGVV